MHLSRYLKIYPCPDQPGLNLLYSTKQSSMALVPDSTLQAARNGSLSEPEALARLGMVVPDPIAEREQMRDIFVNANQKPRPFNGVVVLNLDCNLACPYCYEDRFRGRHYMTPEIALQLVDHIRHEQFDQGRSVKLVFYGGEPLLSLGLIRDISGQLQRAAAEQGCDYSFSLVTNGTLLTGSVVEELLPLGYCGAKVTLDGPAALHNQSRPFVSGKGSFNTIVTNLASICGLAPLQLGGNYTQDNYRDFPLLLDNLMEREITPDKVTTVLFAPVVPKSGAQTVADFNGACTCSHEPWLIEAADYLREETLQRGYSAPKPRLTSCMVEFANDLVINHDGSLYKCPAFMAYDELRIGTLGDGIGDYQVSHNLDLWKNEECLDCPYLPLCFGGCRQLTLLRTGAIDGVDCRREFYDGSLERIIRQDLKYQTMKKD
ncbi:MAG: putative geopeptide radical SAM maturase [Geobacter sp.]|nr:MAG: putative geopeptide radical SAM maturase [Geobacter sp.]